MMNANMNVVAAVRPKASARADMGSPTLRAAYVQPCIISIERLTNPVSSARPGSELVRRTFVPAGRTPDGPGVGAESVIS